MPFIYTSIDEVELTIESIKEDVIRWRRYLHQYPELSFQEEKTSEFVYETLKSFSGLTLSRPTKTSVAARLKGAQAGPVLAIRADMDALPIIEENDFDFASRNHGVMHACGHDGHTAILLAAAKVLCKLKERIHGEILFLFQHAEELDPGGAKEMVDSGVMEGIDTVIGLHLWSSMPAGKIAIASGAVLAAPDTFRIRVLGRGGHAAQPHEVVDSIAIAAQIVANLQYIVSRNIDPLEPLVVSVTQISGGTADNIIPGSVELVGTVRTFNPLLQIKVPELMNRIVKGIAEAHGGNYQFVYEKGYEPVVNDVEITDELRKIFLSVFGDNAVVTATPSMGGEDFSAFLKKAPGAFFFIGAGNQDKGITYPHHHPRFTIDEAALSMGVKAFVYGAFALTG